MTANFIRGVMKRLRIRFGRSIELVNVVTSSRDLGTGLVTRSYTRKAIQAVVLPMKEQRDFVYDLSFIAANKNFTYGGQFEIERAIVIVDTVVLDSFNLDLHTVILIGGRPHLIEKFTREWAGDHYRMLQVKRTEEANLTRVGVTPVPVSVAFGGVDPTVS